MPKGQSEKLVKYRGCMSSGMKGKQFPTAIERRKYFCALAKVCSGKTDDLEKAAKMCLEKHPQWRSE